jgi:hypothetical protein
MKIHRIKNYLKLGSLLFGVSLFMVHCESEHIQPEKTTNRYSVKRIYADEIKENKNVVNALGKFNDQQAENNSAQYSKEIYNSYYDFSIETDESFYIEYDEYHSYTFNIHRNNDSSLTENLVLSLQTDLNYKVFLVSYDLTQEEIELIRNHEYVGVLDKINIRELEGFNTDDLLRSVGDCYEWGTIYVSQGTGWEIPGWVKVDCPEEISAGDSSTGGGESPINDGPDTSGDQDPLGGGGGPGGGGGNDDEGNTPDDDEECLLDSSGNCIENVTTPFPPKETPEEELEDCEKLKTEISDVQLIKTRLKELKDANGNFEKGLRVDVHPATGVYTPTDVLNSNNGTSHVSIPVNPYTAVVAHTHPPSEDGFYAMFSGPDIIKMAEIMKYTQSINPTIVKPTDITHILIADGNTFAIRFDDAASAQALLNIYEDTTKRTRFLNRLQKDYDSDNTGYPLYQSTTTVAKQQQHLYDLLSEFNLNMSVFEANYNLNGSVSNWQKINKETLEKDPCN